MEQPLNHVQFGRLIEGVEHLKDSIEELKESNRTLENRLESMEKNFEGKKGIFVGMVLASGVSGGIGGAFLHHAILGWIK